VFNEQHRSLIQSLSLPQFDLISNDRQELGQLYSLQLAIREIPREISGILLCLADHPLIKEETYHRIVGMHSIFSPKVIIPTYEDRPGHPAIFPRVFFREILDLSPTMPEGVKNIFFNHPEDVLDLPVQDPGILLNLDTPEDIPKDWL
jgi:molybdenum cofactor cytidylyltransferase